MKTRNDFALARRVVVKIGSSQLTAAGQGLDVEAISGWVSQVAALTARGVEVILVSSGSVAEGVVRLGWKKRPQTLHELQAAASVGQMGLVQAYESCFQRHGLKTAQVLLTNEDLSDRQRYLNARNTLLTLVGLGVIPVINENDAVATDEIRFGDNDTLAALVANLVEADLLIILTDQEGIFDADPGVNPAASLIVEIPVSDERLDQVAGGSRSGLGRGGMMTKVTAGRLAARSGTATVIASGHHPQVISRVIEGVSVGTLLVPEVIPMDARKRWLAGQLQVAGHVVVDAGAERVLLESGKSLLPVGVVAVAGDFRRGELISCRSESGREVARGLSNYSADETRKIAGRPSSEIELLLGYVDQLELVHRDNLVVM